MVANVGVDAQKNQMKFEKEIKKTMLECMDRIEGKIKEGKYGSQAAEKVIEQKIKRFDGYIGDIEHFKEQITQELLINQEKNMNNQDITAKHLKEMKSSFERQLSAANLMEKHERGKLQESILRLLQQRQEDVKQLSEAVQNQNESQQKLASQMSSKQLKDLEEMVTKMKKQ